MLRRSALLATVIGAVLVAGCSTSATSADAEASATQRIDEAVGESSTASSLTLDEQAFVEAARLRSVQAASLSDEELLDVGETYCKQIDEAVAGGLSPQAAIEVYAYSMINSGGDRDSILSLNAVHGAAASTLCAEYNSAFRAAMQSLG